MATAKESPPQGVYGSQTKVLPCVFKGKSLAFYLLQVPQALGRPNKRGVFFCAYSVSLEGALSLNLFPFLPFLLATLPAMLPADLPPLPRVARCIPAVHP